MMTRSSTWKEEHQLHSSWEQFTRCVIFLSKNNSTAITQSSLNFKAKKVHALKFAFALFLSKTSSNLTFQPAVKSTLFIKHKWFYRSSFLHNFSFSKLIDQNLILKSRIWEFFDLLEPTFCSLHLAFSIQIITFWLQFLWWISNICFWLCYTFTDLMATFQPQIDCVSSHCLTIPKGKWFSMLITSRKNENVATLLTSFMTSTMGSFSLAEFWIVASTCCSSKNLEVVNESTFSPITLRMRSSPHMIFKSGWRCCGQELCKITRDEL